MRSQKYECHYCIPALEQRIRDGHVVEARRLLVLMMVVVMVVAVAVIVAAQRARTDQLIVAAVALLEAAVAAVAAERVERVVLRQLQIVATDRVHAVAAIKNNCTD